MVSQKRGFITGIENHHIDISVSVQIVKSGAPTHVIHLQTRAGMLGDTRIVTGPLVLVEDIKLSVGATVVVVFDVGLQMATGNNNCRNLFEQYFHYKNPLLRADFKIITVYRYSLSILRGIFGAAIMSDFGFTRTNIITRKLWHLRPIKISFSYLDSKKRA